MKTYVLTNKLKSLFPSQSSNIKADIFQKLS